MQHDGARGRCLVARRFQPSTSSIFRRDFEGESAAAIWSFAERADRVRRRQPDLFPPEFAWPHEPAEHPVFGSGRLLAQALRGGHEDFIQRYFKVLGWLKNS